MEETVIQKILSESYNFCNLKGSKLLIKKGISLMGRTKTEGKSYTKVTRFYFRACSPLSIRLSKSETIEWE